jgi:hypothetical protein
MIGTAGDEEYVFAHATLLLKIACWPLGKSSALSVSVNRNVSASAGTTSFRVCSVPSEASSADVGRSRVSRSNWLPLYHGSHKGAYNG